MNATTYRCPRLAAAAVLLVLITACSQLSGLWEDRPPLPYQRDNVFFVARGEDLTSLISADYACVVVYFSDKYCRACKSYDLEFKKFATALASRNDVRFVRFDTFYDSGCARGYGVKSVPSTVFFKNDKKLKILVGVVSSQDLLRAAKTLLVDPQSQ